MSKETLSPASLARPMMLDILAASLIMEDNMQWFYCYYELSGVITLQPHQDCPGR